MTGISLNLAVVVKKEASKRKQTMKSTFALVIILTVTSSSHAQQFNNFEINQNLDITIDTSLENNIWTIGSPEKIKFKEAYSVPNAIFIDTSLTYSDNNFSTFQFTIDQNGFWMFPYFVLQFHHKIDTEYKRDGGWIEASYDKGMTWQNVFTDTVFRPMVQIDPSGLSLDTLYTGEIAFTGTQDNFYPVTLCWGNGEGNPPIPNVDSVQIRFVFRTDSIPSSHEGWMLDNFDVYGTLIDAIEEKSDPDPGFYLYPNPARGAISVLFGKERNGRVDIFDRHARIVISFPCQSDRLTIDTSNLPRGIYSIRFTGASNRIYSRQFLIVE